MQIAVFSGDKKSVDIAVKNLELTLYKNQKLIDWLSNKNESVEFSVYYENFDQENLLKQKIDVAIIFEDVGLKFALTKKIKLKYGSCVNIYISSQNSSLQNMINDHIDDFMLSSELLAGASESKLKIWLELSFLRQHDMSVSEDGKNIFNVKTCPRRTRFDIHNEGSLNLLWEFFLNDKRFDRLSYASDWIQACYSICLKLLDLGYKPFVVFGENNAVYSLTISPLPIGKKAFYRELVEYAQLEKLRFISHSCRNSKGIFSLRLLKDLSFEEESNTKTPPPQEEQTAAAYIPLKNPSMSVDSAREYIKECGINEEDLSEIRLLNKDVEDDLDETDDLMKSLRIYGRFFIDFSEAIKKLLAFEDLRNIISDIGKIMLEVKEVEKIERSVFFADLIRRDLTLWFNHIFILQDAQNVHYLDASLASSCHKIKECLSPESVGVGNDDCELELF